MGSTWRLSWVPCQRPVKHIPLARHDRLANIYVPPPSSLAIYILHCMCPTTILQPPMLIYLQTSLVKYLEVGGHDGGDYGSAATLNL
jgi:hypothetical protein